MITLEALQSLDAIDRRGSFAAAAAELHKVPSALSYTIKQLEEQLGVALFDRSGQRAQLTDTGRLVLKQGRELLRGAEALTQRARQAASGWEPVLRLVVESILPMSPLWPVIADFSELQPGIEIDLREEALSGGWEALADQRADLLVGVGEDSPSGLSLERRPLGRLSMVLVCAPEHPLAARWPDLDRTESDWAEQALRVHAQIVLRDSARRLPARSIGLFQTRRRILVDHYYAKEQAILAGLGFGALPSHRVRPFLAAGRLAHLAGARPELNVPLYLVCDKARAGRGVHWLMDAILARNSFADLLD